MATTFIAGYELSSRTTVARKSTIRSSLSESGKRRFFNVGAQTMYTVGVVIEVMTEAEKEALVDWMVTNETAEIDLTVYGETYRGYINPEVPIDTRSSPQSPNLWTATFAFEGVKQ